MAPNAEQGEIFNRILFHTRYQEENESISAFAANLKKLLRVCRYKADCVLLDFLARDRFIAGILDKELQAFLTTQPANITFDSVIETCINLKEYSPIKRELQEPGQNYGEDKEQLADVDASDPANVTNVFDIKFENENTEEILEATESLLELEDNDTTSTTHLIGKSHKCFYCPYESAEKSTLEKHILAVHSTEKVFKCEKCEFSTGWKCSLRKHLLNVHKESTDCVYTCNECKFSTKFSRVYKKHLMSLKITGKCDIVDSEHEIDQYKLNEPVKCPHCNYTRTQRSKIINHIKSVHEDAKPFKCTQCKSSFKLKFRLTAHMKLSHGDGKVKILIMFQRKYF